MRTIIFIITALATLPLQASEAIWKQCAAISNDAARLACFDAYARQLPADGAAPQVSVTNNPTTTAAPVSSAKSVSPELGKASAEGDFGLENKVRQEQKVDEIVTHFEGAFTGWEPKQKLTLANGQVWQISDNSTASYRIDNPKIVIKRGLWSAFYMEVEGLNRTPKVKRVK